jgi:hypothetical protein
MRGIDVGVDASVITAGGAARALERALPGAADLSRIAGVAAAAAVADVEVGIDARAAACRRAAGADGRTSTEGADFTRIA